MTDWLPAFIIGTLGVFATIYGTRSTRKTAQEAAAESGIRETLKTAVDVNQKTYEALALEQKATILRLEEQMDKLNKTNQHLIESNKRLNHSNQLLIESNNELAEKVGSLERQLREQQLSVKLMSENKGQSDESAITE